MMREPRRTTRPLATTSPSHRRRPRWLTITEHAVTIIPAHVVGGLCGAYVMSVFDTTPMMPHPLTVDGVALAGYAAGVVVSNRIWTTFWLWVEFDRRLGGGPPP